MRLPKMPTRQAQSLCVPDLAGGLNLRDGMSEILDNQLTDARNMWFKDGVLKTRPALFHTKTVTGLNNSKDTVLNYTEGFKKHNITRTIGSEPYVLCSSMVIDNKKTDDGEEYTQTTISFWWINGTDGKYASRLIISGETQGYFVIQKDTTLYLFTTERKIYQNVDNGIWQEVPAESYYAPVVVSYCQAYGGLGAPGEDKILSGGVMVDGYNMLSEYYKMEYNSFNPEIAEELLIDGETKEVHFMSYPLLKDIRYKKYIGKTVTLEYTTTSGKVATHSITITEAALKNRVYESEANEVDGLKMALFGRVCWLCKDKTPAYISESGGENDIVITAPYIPKGFENAKDNIFKMRECCWFGGAVAGLAGGNRLFLCGNTTKGKKSLVCWSGLNDPLYFSENAYFYVGDDSSAVTGFGKQSDKLIIFKENETWYTQYYQNTDISAEDLINQSVVDLSASSVYFPLVQINPNIGCPYPDTIQLCRNRLIWLGESGKVYTLVSESQYNERSIYVVSEMVQSRLADVLRDVTAKGICAVDWNGYYCLCYNKQMFLMDYNNYGYTHIASHSKTEDANIRIPWYCWELESHGRKRSFAVTGDELAVIDFTFGLGVADEVEVHIFKEGAQGEVNSSITTKLFSFSAPHYRKNIDRIDLQLGNNGGEPIIVELITDCGNEEHILYMQSPQTDKRQAGYVRNLAVFPKMRQITQLAVRLSCKDRLIIDSMYFKFRITGGVR